MFSDVVHEYHRLQREGVARVTEAHAKKTQQAHEKRPAVTASPEARKPTDELAQRRAPYSKAELAEAPVYRSSFTASSGLDDRKPAEKRAELALRPVARLAELPPSRSRFAPPYRPEDHKPAEAEQQPAPRRTVRFAELPHRSSGASSTAQCQSSTGQTEPRAKKMTTTKQQAPKPRQNTPGQHTDSKLTQKKGSADQPPPGLFARLKPPVTGDQKTLSTLALEGWTRWKPEDRPRALYSVDHNGNWIMQKSGNARAVTRWLDPSLYGGTLEFNLGFCADWVQKGYCEFESWEVCPLRHWKPEPREMRWMKESFFGTHMDFLNKQPFAPDHPAARYNGRPRTYNNDTVFVPEPRRRGRRHRKVARSQPVRSEAKPTAEEQKAVDVKPSEDPKTGNEKIGLKKSYWVESD